MSIVDKRPKEDPEFKDLNEVLNPYGPTNV